MSKIARVKFIRDKEPNIKALTAENKVLDGALYVATDTGTLWMGISSSSLIQIKDNINTNTTYNLTKSGSTITLRGSDGSTFNVTDSNTVYGNATASAAGLMSAADKAKLDGVASGSNHVAVDAELSTTSTNPVQNKVIKSALDGKSNTGHKHVKAQITDFPTSMPASDVYSWAKQPSKPSYTISEVSGNLPASRISGTIAAANLPSYVDDILEYASLSKFPTTGESGKIYTALDTNKIYRWSGSAYVVISETVALGTTHSSAGYGDESRAAYNHSTKTSGNPHHVTKADVGLGSVDNTADSAKSVKYATSAGSVAWSNVSGRPSSMPASDVYSWAKQPSKPSYTISEVSGNLPASRISGTIAAANLPSYVDDILEYASLSKFPTTGESGKIYTALDTNKIYRWSGSAYVVISETVALGTTHSSAGYGDESRAAYNHSTKTSGNPHHVTKADVGLGSVDNTADSAKSVKYATSAGSVAWSNVSGRPSSMPASDVYSWAKQPSKPSYTASEVGAAPASHSHSYLPLAGGTVSGDIHFSSIGDKAKAAGITWDGSTDGASIYYETRSADSGHLVLNMTDDANVTVDIAAEGAVKSYFGYDGTFHGNVAGNASSASSVAWGNVTGRPTIPSVGNGTVTITQNGTNKGSFTLNQSGNATIALTDTNTNTWRPEEVIVSSSQPNASTCKLWIKV